jgi:E3 ubiquitin-protein ligase mind-bomb
MPQTLIVGIRVVRGIDWEWNDQDGGKGYVGTIVEVGGQNDSRHPVGTVVVCWDSGHRANYRAGYGCKDDLRVLDSAPAGYMSMPDYPHPESYRGSKSCRWK